MTSSNFKNKVFSEKNTFLFNNIFFSLCYLVFIAFLFKTITKVAKFIIFAISITSKLDNGVVSGIYSGKLDFKMSLRLPDYCSVFQAEMVAIYRATQWILANDVPFHRVSIFSNS